MEQAWKDRWNDRYRQEEFAYGEAPNEYLKGQLDKLKAGTILFPAEGEGRNAVYAAKQGWSVAAFDISSEGQKKALRLAAANHVTMDYRVGEPEQLNYQPEQFDAMALIYAHFPANIKSSMHKMLSHYLRKDGIIIFEAFSKKHLDYIARDEKMGGPRDLESLFSIEEIKSDFMDYYFTELIETEVELHEGPYHQGKGSVIRFLARKNK